MVWGLGNRGMQCVGARQQRYAMCGDCYLVVDEEQSVCIVGTYVRTHASVQRIRNGCTMDTLECTYLLNTHW